MINIINEKCTGCGVCAAICPKEAIYLAENKNGFREPVVDPKRCVECGLCKKICNVPIEYKNPKVAYIAKHNDESIHKKSQSGGAFTVISDYILSQGGVVYGAVFDTKFEVVHVRATSIEERDKMRGSKYIQSNIDYVYKEIENDLKCGRLVLFSGTGCQVSSILKYCSKKNIDLSNLYTVDILCHGVPSLILWRDVLQYLQKKYHADISAIYLKEAEEGSRPTMNIIIGEHEINDYLYRKLYYSNLALRASCYTCQYNKKKRVGDITIGDAWGVEKNNPSFNSKRGVSLIMVNSMKGLKIQKTILQNMVTERIDIDDYLQECMVSSAKPKRDPALFWKDYHKKRFSYIIEKYAKHNLFLNIPYIFERIYKRIMR